MSFEQTVRDRISKAPYGSTEKNILKVVLGDIQLKAAGGTITDEAGHAIVKKLVKGNEETLGHLKGEDPRRAQYLGENAVLSSLLPTYLTADQVTAELTSAGLVEQVKAAKNEGQATGVAMKHLKGKGLAVEGDEVKKAVTALRS